MESINSIGRATHLKTASVFFFCCVQSVRAFSLIWFYTLPEEHTEPAAARADTFWELARDSHHKEILFLL